MILALLALLACRQADPDLASQEEALEDWRAGKAHLAEEEFARAVAAFEEALERRPKDPVLRAWLAHALAKNGDLDAAIAVLDTLIAEYPTFAEARYNRAAYLARAGDLEAAGADLQQAIEAGARPSREVLEDPDFAPHLDHPAFAFLPRQALVVAVDVPEGPAFLGNEVEVRLRVLGTEGDKLAITAEEASGPVRLIRVVEDVVASSEGPGRELTFTFEVLGPGSVTLGPLDIRSNGHAAAVEAITFETVAPEGREAPADLPPLALTTASEVGEVHGLPSATWIGDRHLLVKALPGDRIEVDPDPGIATRTWELREGGKPQWVLYRYDLAMPPQRIRVIRNGKPVLDGAPQSG